MLDTFPSLGWLQNFFESTSWSICLSRLRSATMRFNRRFSSSSCLKRRSSETPRPPYFFFHRKYVCSAIPIFRQTSATRVPVSACRSANAICSSVNFDFFIDKTSFKRFCQKTHIMSGPFFRDEVRDGPLPWLPSIRSIVRYYGSDFKCISGNSAHLPVGA